MTISKAIARTLFGASFVLLVAVLTSCQLGSSSRIVALDADLTEKSSEKPRSKPDQRGASSLVWKTQGDALLLSKGVPIAAKIESLQDVSAPTIVMTPMPIFPWPPPKPSVETEIEAGMLTRGEDSSLMDLGNKLERALKGAGYHSSRFFGVPGRGFAIVTRIERFNENGTSAEEPIRWTVSDSSGEFALNDFLTALLTGRTGQYRLFVIVVTDQPFNSDDKVVLTSQGAERLLDQGFSGLPSHFRASPWTSAFRVYALVYEFEKREGEDPIVRKPKISAVRHLRGSCILKYF